MPAENGRPQCSQILIAAILIHLPWIIRVTLLSPIEKERYHTSDNIFIIADTAQYVNNLILISEEFSGFFV